MRTLVTGGAGFIGSHIVDVQLAGGAEVLVVDDLSSGRLANLAQDAEFLELDIRDPRLVAAIARFRPEAIIHCAAQSSVVVSMRAPGLDAAVNIVGGVNLIDGAVKANCGQFLYVTTGGALYGQPQYLPMDEQHPVRPESGYGLSKWTMERYLALLAPATMPVKVLRLANVYGPRQDPHGEAGVVAIFGGRMVKDEPVTIFGDGSHTRDYVYVADITDAVERALAKSESLTVNIATGAGASVNEIFTRLAAAAGYTRAPVHGPDRPGDVEHSVLTNARARDLLGWSPRMELNEGLRRTLESIRQEQAAAAR